MHKSLFVLWILLGSIASAAAQVTVGIGVPGLSIGINFPVYPELVRVPGYPVYYAPQANSNYFFYDGMYWVYQGDNWYTSSWYNGPWQVVNPEFVPMFVLRVPVRYYRQPPVYFHGWVSDAPPRWGEHWGNSWEQQHRGWDNWDRHAVPAPAPLPSYQRQYSGNRYPQVQQQQTLQSQNYRYQPRDAEVQRHYQAQPVQSAPAPAVQARPAAPPAKSAPPPEQRGYSRPPSLQQATPTPPSGQTQQRSGTDTQRPVTTNAPQPQSVPAAQPPKPQPKQAKPPAPDTGTQRQSVQPQPGTVQRQPQAQKPQVQDKPPQGKPPAQDSGAQRQSGKPQQGAAQQEAPKAQGQDKSPQGKPAARETKKDQDKNEQQGGERSK